MFLNVEKGNLLNVRGSRSGNEGNELQGTKISETPGHHCHTKNCPGVTNSKSGTEGLTACFSIKEVGPREQPPPPPPE